jgi:hypothetical protein
MACCLLSSRLSLVGYDEPPCVFVDSSTNGQFSMAKLNDQRSEGVIITYSNPKKLKTKCSPMFQAAIINRSESFGGVHPGPANYYYYPCWPRGGQYMLILIIYIN